ncbi:hypothetical protein [Winogradskyella sp. 3972H.M.0a.05]|uniref:hypothetical protein n=1 Tax=Winogradskyella sp. 3972H.M.0a.05 TaxID=2950277 RepID=UPI0033917C36
MKTRITVLLAALLITFNIGFAQQDEECMTNLTLFSDAAKKGKKDPKGYDEAYEPWMAVRKKCPKFNRAIYQYGEKILNHKIKNASGSEKVAYINDLVKLLGEGNQYFTKYYKKGDVLSEIAQIKYKYKKDLGLSDQNLYDEFDSAFKTDKANFKHPQRLYTYFSLVVDLFDAGKQPAQAMFDKYDDVNEKVEEEVKKNSDGLNKLMQKEEAGTALTKKENGYKKQYSSYLENYAKISGSMDQKLGDRANCEVLIPLYDKNFESNKNDNVWLQRAMNRMYAKGCKEDPLFVKLVEQKHSLEPNASTSFYLYLLTGEQKYFDETVRLETDPFKKAKLYKKIAREYKDKGSYGKARQYYTEALKLNPSDKKPHISIAAMYAKSANRCGDTNFNKRAVFWLAANELKKAGVKAGNYEAKAPSRADIFNEDMAGKTIKIGCWIGRSVKVPSL